MGKNICLYFWRLILEGGKKHACFWSVNKYGLSYSGWPFVCNSSGGQTIFLLTKPLPQLRTWTLAAAELQQISIFSAFSHSLELFIVLHVATLPSAATTVNITTVDSAIAIAPKDMAIALAATLVISSSSSQPTFHIIKITSRQEETPHVRNFLLSLAWQQ